MGLATSQVPLATCFLRTLLFGASHMGWHFDLGAIGSKWHLGGAALCDAVLKLRRNNWNFLVVLLFLFFQPLSVIGLAWHSTNI